MAGGANVVNGQDPAGVVPGAVVAMCRQALASSALEPHDIALIKPQAAGSTVNDATEARALRQVFDPLPALLSLKTAIGHTLGAAGAAEVALLTACLETGIWPTFDYAQDASLNAPLADRAPQHVRYVLASILGFGGGHAAIVLEDREA
jgi:3-oxoacyl-[acyl-carrier-protein] synthase-1